MVVKAVLGSHFGWQVNSPPILGPNLVGIGMFTGGTIWILTHGQVFIGSRCWWVCRLFFRVPLLGFSWGVS